MKDNIIKLFTLGWFYGIIKIRRVTNEKSKGWGDYCC